MAQMSMENRIRSIRAMKWQQRIDGADLSSVL